MSERLLPRPISLQEYRGRNPNLFPLRGSISFIRNELAANSINLTDREQSWTEQKLKNGVSPDNLIRPDFWKGRRRLKVTAMHELGHATVAKARGWFVTTISVLREGNVLGYVKSVPNRSKDVFRLLKDKIALSYGGYMMEEKIGHTDHRGASSDMAQARRAAIILAAHQGGTPEDYLQEGRQTANADINSVGSFEDASENLMEKGILAA